MGISKIDFNIRNICADISFVAFPWGAITMVFAATALADGQPLGQISENLRITGEFRGRYEAYDFFQPGPAANTNNEYDFWALRGRLGVLATSRFVEGYVQGEYSGVYGLPNDAFATPGGALGLGALYYTENHLDTSPSDVHLKQAYVNFKFDPLGLNGLSLKAGRFEVKEGLEYKTGDAKFDALKTTRVSQRLLGTFDFAHASRNFDGVATVYDQPHYNISISATHPTEGGFNLQGQDEISDIDLFYTAITSKKDALLQGVVACFTCITAMSALSNRSIIVLRPSVPR